jgi:hypothetical protein
MLNDRSRENWLDMLTKRMLALVTRGKNVIAPFGEYEYSHIEASNQWKRSCGPPEEANDLLVLRPAPFEQEQASSTCDPTDEHGTSCDDGTCVNLPSSIDECSDTKRRPPTKGQPKLDQVFRTGEGKCYGLEVMEDVVEGDDVTEYISQAASESSEDVAGPPGGDEPMPLPSPKKRKVGTDKEEKEFLEIDLRRAEQRNLEQQQEIERLMRANEELTMTNARLQAQISTAGKIAMKAIEKGKKEAEN